MHSGGECIIQIKLMNQYHNLRDMARIEVKMFKFIFVFFLLFYDVQPKFECRITSLLQIIAQALLINK